MYTALAIGIFTLRNVQLALKHWVDKSFDENL